MSATHIIRKPKMAAYQAKYGRKARTVVRLAAEEVARRARHLAPVDTGRLRASIDTVTLSPVRYGVKAQTNYAKWVEFGSKRWSGKPFLRPATESVRRSLAALWRKA